MQLERDLVDSKKLITENGNSQKSVDDIQAKCTALQRESEDLKRRVQQAVSQIEQKNLELQKKKILSIHSTLN